MKLIYAKGSDYYKHTEQYKNFGIMCGFKDKDRVTGYGAKIKEKLQIENY